MLNVLVACKEPTPPDGLHHLPQPWRMQYCCAPGWSVASNKLLDWASVQGGDALFLDDDTALTEGFLGAVFAHYDHADLFGLDLHDLSGARQAGARHVLDQSSALHDWVQPGPAYVAHVSTSAIYLKASAVKALRFPEWPGIHWEDVALCLDAWLHGLRVLAVPGRVNHAIEGGVGATKRHDAQFWSKWGQNMQAFGAWCEAHNVRQALSDGRIPVGAREL